MISHFVEMTGGCGRVPFWRHFLGSLWAPVAISVPWLETTTASTTMITRSRAAWPSAGRGGLERGDAAGRALGWLRPSVGVQTLLTRLAHTDLVAQRAYQDRSRAFHARLRSFYYGYLFHDRPFEAGLRPCAEVRSAWRRCLMLPGMVGWGAETLPGRFSYQARRRARSRHTPCAELRSPRPPIPRSLGWWRDHSHSFRPGCGCCRRTPRRSPRPWR